MANMKIAEALIERVAMKTKISELESRIAKNLLVQEGEEVSDNPNELIKELATAEMTLTRLISKIQRCNSDVYIVGRDGNNMDMTLQEALIKRDGMQSLAQRLRSLAGEAVPNARYSRSEIRMISQIDVKNVLNQADTLAKEARELDILIQQTNWLSDI